MANRFTWEHEYAHVRWDKQPYYLDEANSVFREYYLVWEALKSAKAKYLAVEALHALKPLFQAEEILEELEKRERVDEEFVEKLSNVILYGLIPAFYIGMGWKWPKGGDARAVERAVLHYLKRKYPKLHGVAKRILRGFVPRGLRRR